MICPEVHETGDHRYCVKTFPHRRHKAEKPSPLYAATDVWTWGPHEPEYAEGHPAHGLQTKGDADETTT